jgi:polyisoprenoid-binding protein YceI
MKLHSLIALTCLATAVHAAPETFDFKDPKGVNNAVFKLTAPLETIEGSASGISGTVSFDPENPAATALACSINSRTCGQMLVFTESQKIICVDFAG